MFKRFLAVQYALGLMTAEQVQDCVTRGLITQTEAEEILG